MKKFFLILISVIILFIVGIWFFYFRGGHKGPRGPKPVPMAVSKHSEVFNESVQSLLTAYYNMSEGFVTWDTLLVAKHGQALKMALDSLRVDEMKADTTGIYESALDPLSNAKSEVNNILIAPTIDAKRVAFNSLSENLRLLFIVVKYDREKLYWQECAMAFGEDKSGNWLSRTAAVRNPYLGTMHPTYKDEMVTCGSPKDTINFVQVDTSEKR